MLDFAYASLHGGLVLSCGVVWYGGVAVTNLLFRRRLVPRVVCFLQ